MARKKAQKKLVKVAEGKKLPKKKVAKLRKKPGGSNIGEYTEVKPKNFAGPAGDAPAGTFPINTKKRAKAALAYARNAPDPEGIRQAVYKKYPALRPEKKNGKKK